ncbi:hypothetical protein [Leadbetterella byssophila]|uniref:hypothetical protein n=1 Tax=Leadbetterella byssophila TaxID=316068 RepID=UPI0039A24B79
MVRLLFWIFLLSSTYAWGQSSLGLGFRGGYNATTISRTYYSFGSGYYGGVYAEIPLGSRFYLQPEFTYSKQVSKGEIYSVGSSDKVGENPEIQYLGFGILGKFGFTPSFRLMLGHVLDQAIVVKKPYRGGFDPVFTIGAEYKSPVGLGLELRFKKGLRDQITEYETFKSTGVIFNMNTHLVFQLGLNYTL